MSVGAVDKTSLPPIVAARCSRAEEAGFPLSCEPGVGRFLAVLAAAVPLGGRILEMGTGVGVGTAWIVHGLGRRLDVEVITIERDPDTAATAGGAPWPRYVSLRTGDVLEHLADLGAFDLIFADAQGGKWEGLERTIAALRPSGLLVVDDMTPPQWMNDEHRQKTAEVRRTLFSHPDLIAAELSEASGIIVATKRQ